MGLDFKIFETQLKGLLVAMEVIALKLPLVRDELVERLRTEPVPGIILTAAQISMQPGLYLLSNTVN